MDRHFTAAPLGAMLATLLLAYGATAGEADQKLRSEAGDYQVYVGVVRADRIAEHPHLVPIGHAIETGRNQYHVELAVFEKSTGRRIEDASIATTVEALGLNAERKHMHRMDLAGAITYCNYFHLQPGDYYTFKLDLLRPDWQTPLHMQLAYGKVSP